MYAKKLSPLIRRFPQEAESLRRMENYLSEYETQRSHEVHLIRLDPNRMFDILQAGTLARLSRIIGILLEGEVFRRQILVRFPSGMGITFSSYAEIPETIRDPQRDVEVEVTDDLIEPSYILVKNEAG